MGCADRRGWKIPPLEPSDLASTVGNNEAIRHVVTAITAAGDDGRALMVALACHTSTSNWFENEAAGGQAERKPASPMMKTSYPVQSVISSFSL